MKKNNFRNLFSTSLLFRAVSFWLSLCVLAFVNGALREILIKPVFKMIDPAANQLSCLTGVLLWTTFTIWFWKPLNIKNLNQSLVVGLGWFSATFLFETFFIGRNSTWDQIAETYNVSGGQYWGLVLLWVGLMPTTLYFILNFKHYEYNAIFQNESAESKY